jgi:hypothetical protein
MSEPRHQGDTKTFGELTFAEQAKSITASINNLQSAIEHHISNAPDSTETRRKCNDQIQRLLNRLLDNR